MNRLGSVTHPSIVNIVLGPITLGPSSSHLAGPLRLGRLGRSAAGGIAERIEITFSEGGSLAGTYRGHRTDCAVTAGALGWDTRDERIPKAIRCAEERGVQVDVNVGSLDVDHPNAIRLRLWDEHDRRTEVVGTSEGGGSVLVSTINGHETRLNGEYPALLLWMDDTRARDALIGELSGARVVHADPPLVTLRLPEGLSENTRRRLCRHPLVRRMREIPPVMPAPGPGASDRPLFDSAAQIAGLAEARGMDLAELGLQYEVNRQDWSAAEVSSHLVDMLGVMVAARDRGISEKLELSGGITTPGGMRLYNALRRGEMLSSGVMARALTYAVAINEVSASLGLVVAAPTAGGCGVLPGAILAVAEEMNASDCEHVLTGALAAAGAVGAVFAQRVTFLAELCGCQVETGAGSAMAAAAIAWMRGARVQQSLDAAAIALQNILGMECDPVAGLMEVPCITRNALGAVNAVMSADLVTMGINSVIPLDEVLDAVYETGRFRPVQCSGTAGLAVTPTSRKLADEFLRRSE